MKPLCNPCRVPGEQSTTASHQDNGISTWTTQDLVIRAVRGQTMRHALKTLAATWNCSAQRSTWREVVL